MLKDQKFENIVLFPHDNVSIHQLTLCLSGHLSEEKKDGGLPPPTIKDTRRERIRLVKEQFFPPFIVKKLCVLGHATHPIVGRLVVIFCHSENNGKLGKKILEEIISQAEITNIILPIGEIMLIHDTQVTPHAKDFLRQPHKSFTFQRFSVDFFYQRLRAYYLIPNLEVLTQQKKDELLNKKQLNENMLPKLWNSDRLARYLNCKKGTLIDFSRSTLNGYKRTIRTVIEETKEKKSGNKNKK